MRILLGFVDCTQGKQAGLRLAEEVPYRVLRSRAAAARPGPMHARLRDAASPERGGYEHRPAGTATHRRGGERTAGVSPRIQPAWRRKRLIRAQYDDARRESPSSCTYQSFGCAADG